MITEFTFATVAEADALLASVTEWTTLSEPQKQEALEWAVVYMDQTYALQGVTENATLEHVNCQLAGEHVKSSLFTRAAPVPAGLTSKSVEAEGIKTSKSYDTTVTSRWADPFPAITAQMGYAGFKLKKSTSGISTIPLVRR